MSFRVEELGPADGPLLVCIHGLMGGPTEYDNINKPWLDQFRCLMIDLNEASRATEWLDEDAEAKRGLAMLDYDQAAVQIGNYLKEKHPGEAAYFVGISFGGKIIYDFIDHFPELFKGAVVTDVGPGLLSESALYQFAEETIPSINLNQPWPTLKKEIHEKIKERSIRILVQTQIYVPDDGSPMRWRSGVDDLRNMLHSLRITEQWQVLEKVRGPVTVLVAEYLSATSPTHLDRLEKNPYFTIQKVKRSSHFIHITHHKVITQAVLRLISN